MKPFLIPTLLILTSLAACIKSSKILFVSPIATKSHKNVFDPLIDALALRGHELTVISPLRTSKVSSDNSTRRGGGSVTEIVPSNLNQVMGSMKDAFKMREEGTWGFLTSFNISIMNKTCSTMYEMEEVQHLMKHTKFDLLLVNGMLNHCAFGLIHHFSSPHIMITTMPASSGMSALLGNIFPSSFVPEPFLPLSQHMTFFERIMNMGMSCLLPIMARYMYYPKLQKTYQRYIPSAPSIPEIDKRISMLFMNSHFSLTYPRPLLPSVIEVGGMHCRPGQPLPKDLGDYLSGSGDDGFILFSLGSIVKAHNMPESTRKAFINVFAKLKQRVIWKWDEADVSMSDLPPNVKLSSWLPQQDILAHKNIRMFITHGGLLSTQEAAYHGVPLIGIPFFADQDLNMGQAEKNGYAVTLEILAFSQDKLQTAVDKIVNEPKFKENAQRLSRIYKDQPETPLERAIFWVEYVIRHKGAKHMESSAKYLNFFQYYSIDVIAFIFIILFTSLWLVKCIWNFLVCKCMCKLIGNTSNKSKAIDSAKKIK